MQTEKKNNSKESLIILLIAVVLIVIGGLAIKTIKNKGNDKNVIENNTEYADQANVYDDETYNTEAAIAEGEDDPDYDYQDVFDIVDENATTEPLDLTELDPTDAYYEMNAMYSAPAGYYGRQLTIEGLYVPKTDSQDKLYNYLLLDEEEDGERTVVEFEYDGDTKLNKGDRIKIVGTFNEHIIKGKSYVWLEKSTVEVVKSIK